ncbi:hypothetical protein BC828DRAFT_84016 [Blastocladiella britannica]|nr:hypothetical protein BC828DRAFT_84016 [Blastocladiella britannica]
MHHDDATTADSPRMMMTELAPLLEMLAEVLCLTPPAIPSLAAAWTELATTVPKMTTLQAFQNALETMCATVVTSLPHAAGRAAVVAYWRTAVATISAHTAVDLTLGPDTQAQGPAAGVFVGGPRLRFKPAPRAHEHRRLDAGTHHTLPAAYYHRRRQ